LRTEADPFHSVCFSALRGAATLKARALKEVWNIAAIIPVEKGVMGDHRERHHRRSHQQRHPERKDEESSGEIGPKENFLGLCSQLLLARGTELLKRTRKGILSPPAPPRCSPDCILIFFSEMCRCPSLEDRIGLSPPNRSGKARRTSTSLNNCDHLTYLELISTGDAQDEEQTCCRDHHQEEEV